MRPGSFLHTRRRKAVLALVLLVLAAALAASVWLWLPSGPRGAKVVEYPMPVASDIPTAVAVAPDGRV